MTKEEIKRRKDENIPILLDVIKEAKYLATELEKLIPVLVAVETVEDVEMWDDRLDNLIEYLKHIDLR